MALRDDLERIVAQQRKKKKKKKTELSDPSLMWKTGYGQFSPGIDPVEAMYRFRYGMTGPEKVAFADTGTPMGVSPEEAQRRVTEADRAASVYLGTQKWGPYLPQAFNELRNAFGIGTLMGESPEMQQKLREQAILAGSRALQVPRPW